VAYRRRADRKPPPPVNRLRAGLGLFLLAVVLLFLVGYILYLLLPILE
jgi:hypothetical protein